MPNIVAVDCTVPPVLPFGLDHVKRHLAVDHDHDDTLIAAYLEAAVARLDGWTGILGMAILPQALKITLDAFPCGPICLPIGPATDVVAIVYRDSAGQAQTMQAVGYVLDKGRGRIIPTDGWPSTDGDPLAVTVEWKAGAAQCPMPLQAAILMLVAHFYETRKGDAEEPASVRALIAPYRKRMV